MSCTTILIERKPNPRLALGDEVSMTLEASEMLKIIREKRPPSEHFEKIIALMHDQSCLTNRDKLRKYFTHETLQKFASKKSKETETPQLRQAFDEPIRIAFAKANLNPEEPLHWHILTMVLCWSIFPPEFSNSLPSWTATRYCQLLRDARQLKPKHRKASENEISKKLIGYSLDSDTLRKALREARDPKYNRVLAYYVRRGLASIREGYERRGHDWPPLDVEHVRERVRTLGRIHDMSSVAVPNDVFSDPFPALQLFTKLRAGNHSRLMKAMRLNGYETRALAQILQNRHAREDNRLRQLMLSIRDYDVFLKKLKLVLKEDESEFETYVLNHDAHIEQVALRKIIEDKKKEDLERLKDAIVAHYVDLIAKGEIRPSSRGRRARVGDTTAADSADLIRSGRLRSSVTIIDHAATDVLEDVHD
jgi:hypothetical protein